MVSLQWRSFTVAVLTALLVIGAVAFGGSDVSRAEAASLLHDSVAGTAAVGDALCFRTVDQRPFISGSVVEECESSPTSIPSPPSPSPKPPVPAGWTLAWSDEFDGSVIDSSKWNVLTQSTYGDGNKELACLMRDNVRVSGGVMTIAGQRESGLMCGARDARFPQGRSFSSGHLETKGRASFEYGRFEVRAQTPITYGSSKGLWPAFWLRPVDGGIGELDVFESMGSSPGEKNTSNRTEQTIHYDYIGTHAQQNQNYALPKGTFADGFHDYAVEWEPGAIRWYIDGVLTFERTKVTTPWIDEAFSGQFYLRLNMAVGGPVGTPDANTAFPASMSVDYVRVYRR